MFIAVCLASGLSGLILVWVASIIIDIGKQYRTNGFLKKVSPNLPVPYESMSIFGGHVRKIHYGPKNTFLIDELHRKYGKTFGTYYCDKVWVCTTDIELIRAIVLEDPYLNIDRYDTKVPVDEVAVDSIATAEGSQWRRLRQAIAPALALTNNKLFPETIKSQHKIKSSPIVLSDLKSSIDELKNYINWKLDAQDPSASVTLNTGDLFHRFSCDLVFKSFYKQNNLIDYYAEKDYYTNLIDHCADGLVNPAFVWAVINPITRKVLLWFMKTFHSQGILGRNILDFIRQQAKDNLSAKQQLLVARKQMEDANLPFHEDNFTLKDGSTFKRNLIDPIIDSFHKRKITEREFLHSSGFLFYAADKTTADAIMILFHHLACDQEVQDKLRKSILREGEESEYLGWCIDESLRLFPPVTMGCSRTIVKDYVTNDGILIPKGSLVYTSVYSINRSLENWGEDANEFKPDRWSKSEDFHPMQYLSFGYGVRNCVGKHFALYSIRKLAASLLRDYKFTKCNKTPVNLEFSAPVFIYLVFDEQFYLEVSKINSD